MKAPEVVGVLAEDDGMGTGYVMRRVIAEVNPARILASPPPSLIADLGGELARIHAIPAETIPAAIPLMDTAAALAEVKARFLTYGGDRPAIALAIRWCEDHLPPPADPVLVHGDYRMGNIMVDVAKGDGGLAVVLDWELAHRGDAHEDLAFGCMTVWRFGQLDHPAFGVGSLDDYFAAYEAAGGAPVDRARFHFWLVYRTLWWALRLPANGAGVAQRLRYDGRTRRRRAADCRTGTRPAVAARGRSTRRRAHPRAAAVAARCRCGTRRRADEPRNGAGGARLAERGDQARIARPWQVSGRGRDERARYRAARPRGRVCAEDRALSQALLSGATTLAEPGLLAKLRRDVLDKCAVDSPKYAALAAARRMARMIAAEHPLWPALADYRVGPDDAAFSFEGAAGARKWLDCGAEPHG